MKRPNYSTTDHQAIQYVASLPRKMLKYHDHDHMAEHVLYELARPHCLNFHKAAYFVDNPDFDCLKGVAGYCEEESSPLPEDIWQSHDQARTFFSNSSFNNKVRNVIRASHKRGSLADEHLVEEVAGSLGLKSPHYCMWDMKHDNHGILMYEHPAEAQNPSEACVLSGVCLLGFCPIV